MDTKNLKFDTKQVHAGAYKDEFNSATVPIYQIVLLLMVNATVLIHLQRLKNSD